MSAKQTHLFHRLVFVLALLVCLLGLRTVGRDMRNMQKHVTKKLS